MYKFVLLILAHFCLVKPIRGNFRLQILHNNDIHARFAETDSYGASCPEDFVKENKCYGGVARMKQAADDAKEEAKQQNIPSIFLNAGDSFQGTPYFTIYKWKIVVELINKMGLDVMALGNHEFDDGIDSLVNYLKNVHVPVVCSNLNLTSEKRLDLPILTKSKILTVEGRKIGVIGYLTPETMEISHPENLKILPEIPHISAEAKRLKAEGIKIIIALGHSGFNADVEIAKEIDEISVVVGAHSHSLLYTPKNHTPSTEEVRSEYPTMVKQSSGKIVPVVQAYGFSKYLGSLLVEFDEEGNMINATGNTHLLDYHVKKDPELDKEMSKWSALIDKSLQEIKGYTRTFLKKPNFNKGELESAVANLITDAFVDMGVQLSNDSKVSTWTRAPIAFYHNGGIRSIFDHKKNHGALTLEELMFMMPFQDKLVEISLRGNTLRKALEFSVSRYDSTKSDFDPQYYLHFSGLRVIYDFTKETGNRVKSVEVLCTECEVPEFEPLQDDEVYRVITVSYIANGGDNFNMIKDEQISEIQLGIVDLDAMIRYIEKNKIVYPKLDNRVITIGFSLTQLSSSSFLSKISFYLITLLPLMGWVSY